MQTSVRRPGFAPTCIILLLIISHVSAPSRAESTWIRHRGFDVLRLGQAGDGGANLYVSVKGRIQTINRWDLNCDGEIDLLFTQDHNDADSPDALVYYGGPRGFKSLLPVNWPLRAPFSLLQHIEAASKRIVRLPAEGGGRAVVADINLDRYPDVVFANFIHSYRPDQSVYVYWGGASGFSTDRRTQLPAYRASGLAIGDLNGDQLPDVVVANRGDEVGEFRGLPRFHLESFVYWNTASGLDTARRTALPTVSARDVCIGDFNGDRHPDVAFANRHESSSSLYVYFGDGTGRFEEARRQILQGQDLHADKKMHVNTLASSDLNNDGTADLIAAGSGSVVMYQGSRDGLMSPPVTDLPATGVQGIVTADLNADGHGDLAVACGGTHSSVFWASDEGFQADRRTDLPTRAATSVAASDFNNDGRLDLLFGNSRGDGRSDGPSYIYWGSDTGLAPHRRKELFGFGVAGTGAADMNLDGWSDILLVNHLSGGGGILSPVIYWGNADHHYSEALATRLDIRATMEYSVADLDDDDWPDIVFITEGHAVVCWGSPEGYDIEKRTRLPVDSAICTAVADLNRDGRLDVVVGASGNRTTGKPANAVIIWGNDRRFDAARRREFMLSGSSLESVALADFDRDGAVDLLFPMGRSNHSEIRWGENFADDRVTKLEANGAPHAVPADLDGDGWLDIVLTSGSTDDDLSVNTKTFIYWGGPAGFKKSGRTELEAYVPLDAAVADLNRDGHLDIVLTNYKSDTTRQLPAYVYWGDGQRHFGAARRTLLTAHSSSAVAALDLNRDGWLELIVSNHKALFDHSTGGTNIYWGGSDGLSYDRRDHLPTMGVHLDEMVDAGNVYDRRFEQDYISPVIEAPAGATFTKLDWQGEMKFGAVVKLQVRTAMDHQQLVEAAWSGPEGPGSFYERPGAALSSVAASDRFLQYRAVLTSLDGTSYPVLTEIAVACSGD